jgi:hypothetical protein
MKGLSLSNRPGSQRAYRCMTWASLHVHTRINLLLLYTLLYSGQVSSFRRIYIRKDTVPFEPIIKVCRLALTALRQNPVSAVVKHRIAPFRCADECQRCYQKKV